MDMTAATRQKQSIVDKKFHLTFRDLIWILTLFATLTYFYFDNDSTQSSNAQLVEYKLNQLQMDQKAMDAKIDNLIDMVIEEKIQNEKKNNADDSRN